jgi:hypothetical protein
VQPPPTNHLWVLEYTILYLLGALEAMCLGVKDISEALGGISFALRPAPGSLDRGLHLDGSGKPSVAFGVWGTSDPSAGRRGLGHDPATAVLARCQRGINFSRQAWCRWAGHSLREPGADGRVWTSRLGLGSAHAGRAGCPSLRELVPGGQVQVVCVGLGST